MLKVVEQLDSLIQVSCPVDYRLWLQTMYSNFGTKWVKLHRGPMLCLANLVQDQNCTSNTQPLHQRTMDVCCACYPLIICAEFVHRL